MHFEHNFPYDPCYGYGIEDLLGVAAPKPPDDFAAYWQARYRQTMTFEPQYTLSDCGVFNGYQTFDIGYTSTAGMINGWLLIPADQLVCKAVVVGHGYGGREQPDYHLGLPETALLFPCFRGLSRSRSPQFPEQPNQHVLHGIDQRDDYILGGCVEDLWLAISVLALLYPQAAESIGYMGISFGAGIGALALPWDERIKRAHFNVPTFGHQALRMMLPTSGSADSVQRYFKTHHHVLETLVYYDAAIAAGFARQAAHFALALFDPVVAPPGQFAIYNNWAAEKALFILEAGHFSYRWQALQEQQLIAELQEFFGDLHHTL
ncbi:MAG: acetylxylan esterase [Methylococcales bacterium]|nr:acetylxylan esterase [Methylococcales bacterium]